MNWDVLSLEEINRARGDEEYAARQAMRRPAMRTLALAKRDYGNAALERLYFALGDARHEREQDLNDDALVDACVNEAGLPDDLRERAIVDPSTDEYLVQQFRAMSEQKAFGVPTLVFEGAAPIFGPVVNEVPRGESAAEFWDHFRALAQRPEFFEIKRER